MTATEPSHQSAAIGAPSALIVILALASSQGFAQTPAAEGDAAAASAQATPARPVVQRRYLVPYPLYLYPSSCYPYGACGSLLWEVRPQRRPAPPQETAVQAELDIWATSGSPWGYLRRVPPPTPQSQIQPGYRETSTLRPEFGEAAGSAPP